MPSGTRCDATSARARLPRMPRSASPARHRRGCERARLYGFDDDHDGVLVDLQVAATLKDILARSF
jgi:hypothetical protein